MPTRQQNIDSEILDAFALAERRGSLQKLTEEIAGKGRD